MICYAAQILRCKFQPYLKQSNREKLQRNESMNLFTHIRIKNFTWDNIKVYLQIV